MTRGARAAAGAVAIPVAFAAVLAVEAVVASRRQYDAPPRFAIRGSAEPGGTAASGPTLRMAMLGDSTVAGLGAEAADDTLALQTAQRVADATGRRVEVTGYGVSGAATRDVTAEQLPQLADRTPDVIVIVIGSNDVTHLTPPWRFTDDTAAMLAAAHSIVPEAAVVIGGIPLFRSATALPQPLRWVVGRYAGVLRPRQRAVVTGTPGATFVDIAADASPRFDGVPASMSDGFHPSALGYGFWADALAAGVVDALD